MRRMHDVDSKDKSIELFSKSAIELKNIDYDKLTTELKDEYNKELKRSNSNSNKWYISKTEEKRHKNDTKIFVIVDDKVASTGEEFISYLKTLENIVVVGTNTSGSLLSNIYIRSQLPNSHINISFGNIITANKDFEEGKGFQPDVWIGNGDSLDRVLKLILKAPKI
ncbi:MULTISPECIES: S41 family peptidase [Clostridium]|uniref:Peptidase family S41 n=2 Tax=Clostridium cadaveris TaxID=1529 RepID=A0A1I2J6Z1_9CLOT|nr:S41 family peptidase [Clostridium cadaveris]MDU4951539.1 S41 family peptidase [Clostridium sp.]MDM8311358.1 S41 family peptidase [Clostridium cadaveris]NME63266.1 hypothetical protein [Clostridium cadaveris]UFH63552.1 hypothetical protein KQH81_09195 [Clostridium cadaveris]SFF48706.1 Peptidase family S41 [Clostridium cadaveris]